MLDLLLFTRKTVSMHVNTSTKPTEVRLQVARNVAAEVARAGHSKHAARYVASILDCHHSTASRKLDGQIPFSTDDIYMLAVALGAPIETFFPDQRAKEKAA